MNFCRGRRSTAPPSGLPAISPAKGEIGCRPGCRQSPTLQKKTLRAELLISPQVGEMSGRTEGALSRQVQQERR
ncbi:propionyl-coenzyme A carboxylase alpha polypeptide [Mesorhizobium sp. B2-4-6]|nr:propionyl-coenzyme A carboxylase alpha polypeptide [Mesorhizobium sp. B2-4-6]